MIIGTCLRKGCIAIFCFAILLICHGSAIGGTKYVDWTNTGPIQDGTLANPYRTIQGGITGSVVDDTVVIRPGVYNENVVIDKNLILQGTGPDTTVIKGAGGVSLTINANLTVTVEKLTVSHSNGIGIKLNKCTSAVNVLINNVVSASNTLHGFYQENGCTALVVATNCAFVYNGGTGITAQKTSSCFNCITAFNNTRGFAGYFASNLTVIYSNSFSNGQADADVTKSFSISANPLFIDADTGDYRLTVGSPCRNTGSPDSVSRNPDGTRNDMGAYGGPGAAGFYSGYGPGPVVTDILITPPSVPLNGTFTIDATGRAQ